MRNAWGEWVGRLGAESSSFWLATRACADLAGTSAAIEPSSPSVTLPEAGGPALDGRSYPTPRFRVRIHELRALRSAS